MRNGLLRNDLDVTPKMKNLGPARLAAPMLQGGNSSTLKPHMIAGSSPASPPPPRAAPDSNSLSTLTLPITSTYPQRQHLLTAPYVLLLALCLPSPAAPLAKHSSVSSAWAYWQLSGRGSKRPISSTSFWRGRCSRRCECFVRIAAALGLAQCPWPRLVPTVTGRLSQATFASPPRTASDAGRTGATAVWCNLSSSPRGGSCVAGP